MSILYSNSGQRSCGKPVCTRSAYLNLCDLALSFMCDNVIAHYVLILFYRGNL
jgi:hypothetical protein